MPTVNIQRIRQTAMKTGRRMLTRYLAATGSLILPRGLFQPALAENVLWRINWKLVNLVGSWEKSEFERKRRAGRMNQCERRSFKASLMIESSHFISSGEAGPPTRSMRNTGNIITATARPDSSAKNQSRQTLSLGARNW